MERKQITIKELILISNIFGKVDNFYKYTPLYGSGKFCDVVYNKREDYYDEDIFIKSLNKELESFNIKIVK